MEHEATGRFRACLRPAALAAVFGGGLAGTACRDALGAVFPADPLAFPLTTFLINVGGAFLLGLLLEALALTGGAPGRRHLARLAAGTGFLGGFTTYSTFVVESVTRARQGGLGLALGYDALSLVVGFGAAFVAMTLLSRFGGGGVVR